MKDIWLFFAVSLQILSSLMRKSFIFRSKKIFPKFVSNSVYLHGKINYLHEQSITDRDIDQRPFHFVVCDSHALRWLLDPAGYTKDAKMSNPTRIDMFPFTTLEEKRVITNR